MIFIFSSFFHKVDLAPWSSLHRWHPTKPHPDHHSHVSRAAEKCKEEEIFKSRATPNPPPRALLWRVWHACVYNASGWGQDNNQFCCEVLPALAPPGPTRLYRFPPVAGCRWNSTLGEGCLSTPGIPQPVYIVHSCTPKIRVPLLCAFPTRHL